MRPTPQAIAASERLIQQQRSIAWRYSNGRWQTTHIDPATNLPRTVYANAAEAAHFNQILRYYHGVYPGQRTGVMGALSSLRQPVTGALLARGAVGALGFVGGVTGSLAGGALGIAGGLAQGALHLGTNALFAGLALGAGAVYAFVHEVQSATREMVEVSRQIASIRNNTGTPLGVAQSGYFSLRAAGLSGQGASAFLGSDTMRGGIGHQIAGAFGLPDPFSRCFAESLARRSQGMGVFQRQAMLDALSGGHASPELQQLAYTNPNSIRREQAYQNQVQGALGVTPFIIRELSDEFPLFTNRISMFTEAVKMKFVSSMLPSLELGFNVVSDLFIQNSSKISGVLESVGHWMFVEAPGLALKRGQGRHRIGAGYF